MICHFFVVYTPTPSHAIHNYIQAYRLMYCVYKLKLVACCRRPHQFSCNTVLKRFTLNFSLKNFHKNKSTKMSKLLELSNPVFSSYVLWSSILVLKMLAMSILTAVQRFKNGVSNYMNK